MEQSIYVECWHEVDRHKWIESQKLGRDLGEVAVRDWFRRYWPIYCRVARLEHVAGLRYWREFPADDFRLLERLQDPEHHEAVAWIMPLAWEGKENLNLIDGAIENGLPLDRVMRVLTALHLNAGQLAPPDDFPPQYAAPGPVK